MRGRRLARVVVGDRLGAVVFLAALVTYLLTWRVGVLVNDSYTVANTLVAVSEGHLHVERAVYGPGLETPGMGVRDGRFYGRNYGQVFLALPILWLLEAVATVADLRVSLAALWGLTILGLGLFVGAELDRSTVAAYAGSGLALVAFAAAIAGATPIDPGQRYLVALQLQTMLAAAVAGVLIYRLLTRAYDRRVGLAAGLTTVLATPVGFWAQFPKRHVPVTACVLATVYFLYRSREFEGVDSGFRALAYVPVGLAAWVSAAEGVLLLGALLLVDVPTGGRDLRSLATAGVAAIASTVPMFVTNYFVTGNPGEPPRTLSAGGSGSLADRGSATTGGGSDGGTGGAGSGSGAGGGGAGGDTGGVGDAGTGSETLDALLGAADFLLELLSEGLRTALTEPETLFRTFVRGGYIAGVAADDAGQAIRLSFLEAMPLAACIVALPILAARVDVRGRLAAVRARRRFSALGTVDAFAVVYSAALLLVYLPRLPVHASLTVRYLLPCYALAVYGLARVSSVRRVVVDRPAWCAAAVASGVVVGGQLLVLYLWWIDATLGEAFQTHALVGLGVASTVLAWLVADGMGYRNDRLGAVVLGLAAAAGVVLVVLAGLWHLAFVGPRALPVG